MLIKLDIANQPHLLYRDMEEEKPQMDSRAVDRILVLKTRA